MTTLSHVLEDISMLKLSHLSLLFVLPAALLAACSDDAGKTEPGPQEDAGIDSATPETGADAAPEADAAVAPAACSNVEQLKPGCKPLPDRFDASATIEKGCYIAAKSPVIADDVTVTIAAGVTIIFAEGTGLSAGGTSALVAAGTEQDPICLTGDKQQRGFWKGIELGRTEGGDHKIDHVTIEYAGSVEVDSKNAAIKCVSDSRPVNLSVTNTTIRDSGGYGLWLIPSSKVAAFSGNTITKSTLEPVSSDSNVVHVLDATSKYTGNDVDEIEVRANRIEDAATWKSIGVPYHLDMTLDVGAPWTVEAPNMIIVPQDKGIQINGDAAALTAIGTADKDIVFTGEKPERGYWTGLIFGSTNNAANKLDFVTVEYAGRTEHDVESAGVKLIADSHGVSVSITNSFVRECQGFGLYLAASAQLPAFANNIFTQNGLGPAMVNSENVHQLDTTSKYVLNDKDIVQVKAYQVSKTATWLDLGVPYQLDASLHVEGVLTLSPGVTLMLPKDGWIAVDGDDSALHAVGTAAKKVTITGAEKTAGYWHSIRFGNSVNGSNALEYATVEYGGSTGGGGEAGMINAASDSHGVSLSVKNSAISNSGQYGIWLGLYAQYNGDIESSNTFSGNASGNVFKQQ